MRFVSFPQKSMAEDIEFLLKKITGDVTRIVPVNGGHGKYRWTVQRFTGTVWVNA